jgi:predicted ribonuclease YlaK
MSYIMEKANIQFKSVNFMRGRSIQNAIVILHPSIELVKKLLLTSEQRLEDEVTKKITNSTTITIGDRLNVHRLLPLAAAQGCHKSPFKKAA